MIDVNRLLEGLQNDPSQRKTAMTAGGGALAGFATAMLMGKGGRKMMGKAAKYGAVAAIGGLAYHAWQNHQKNKADGTAVTGSVPMDDALPPANSGFLPAPGDASAQNALAQSLVRSMIAAAKADGEIDATEKSRIFERLNTMELDAGTKAFVFDELSNPADINKVVAGVQGPEHAVELYTAALLAIDVDTPAERAYLQMLAARLNLEDGLVAEIHRATEAQTAAV